MSDGLRPQLKHARRPQSCSHQCANSVRRNHDGSLRHILHRLVFMGEKGWGLLAADDIPKGSLVIEYVGEVSRSCILRSLHA